MGCLTFFLVTGENSLGEGILGDGGISGYKPTNAQVSIEQGRVLAALLYQRKLCDFENVWDTWTIGPKA